MSFYVSLYTNVNIYVNIVVKKEVLCYSSCETIKITPCSKAIGTKQRLLNFTGNGNVYISNFNYHIWNLKAVDVGRIICAPDPPPPSQKYRILNLKKIFKKNF